MAKIENKYTYNVKGGRESGVFNIYQDRKGALRLLMGNRDIELTFSQINDLMISVHDLIDFDYDEFLNYYNEKALIDTDEIRMKARELDEKDFAQWMYELQKCNVL